MISMAEVDCQNGQLVPRIESEATIDRLIKGANKQVFKKKKDTWIVKPNSSHNNTTVSSGSSIDETCPTVTVWNGLNLAKAHFINLYYSDGQSNRSVDEVSGCIRTKDCVYPVSIEHFMNSEYTSVHTTSLESPSPALLAIPKQKLIELERFIMDTQFNNEAHSLDVPSRTQTANGKHFYVVNFQWIKNTNGSRSLDEVMNTIIARGDKAPNYLVMLETGELAIEIFDHDPPHYIKMKQYMAEKGIINITMRQLKEVELLKIMSMDATTKLSKSSTANKKMIGNAVPSDLVTHLGAAWSQGRMRH
jgi:DNA (cytosine-5)-methyltransferase 1